MLKKGKYRSIRNMPIGWALQTLHSTDNSERMFRVLLEIIIIAFLMIMGITESFLMTFIFVHSVFWLLNGNFMVYLLDSFYFVKNPGADVIFSYLIRVKDLYVKNNCVDAILIYGSMCRGEFHSRSDLDLRVIRKPGFINGIVALSIGFYLKVISLFQTLPLDLLVLDSTEKLKLMRDDEHPIIVYQSGDVLVDESGIEFSRVLSNPELVYK